MLALSEAAGAPTVADPRLYVPPADQHWWAAERGEAPYAVLATTSRWASKAWPDEHWAALGAELMSRGHIGRIVLPGSPAERARVAPIADAMRAKGLDVLDVAGRTSIGQLMAILQGADLTVSNDSAALHMAVGLGRPFLGLFGPTDPAVVGPWRRPDAAIRAPLQPGERPSYRDRRLGDTIMRRLSVASVVERLEQMAAIPS
jgi:ADP-heptose:LPS heptosyltransferase